jgi:murein DD-endopeptidase MepM/ murein hydrolase activator NlpD
MSRAGERVDLSVALAEVLGSEVDFNTELQPGDRFRLLVDKQYRAADVADGNSDDTFSGYGAIQVVAFQNAGRDIQAMRFTPVGGKPDYYDANGRSLRRFFLKSPLKFDPVVTSSFSMNRMHPVLGERRAHLGVDYRAPAGAPVVAVADGQVVLAGPSGGAGRMVHLRHANGFETEYLHLSTIDVRTGSRVRQGEIIGRVGATGLATGPHLDYRVKQNGVFVNPVAVHQSLPPGDPLTALDMPAFEAVRDRMLAMLRDGRPRPGASNQNAD